jgi:PTH2 family peptidyl-tRNA hydrolase
MDQTPEPRQMKMVIVMRTDLNMRKGKMIAQGAHAATMCLLGRWDGRTCFLGRWDDQMAADIQDWLLVSGMRKICVRVDSEAALLEIERHAQECGLRVRLITDAGTTEFGGLPTKTCLAIGPNSDADIDRVTGSLKLL